MGTEKEGAPQVLWQLNLLSEFPSGLASRK